METHPARGGLDPSAAAASRRPLPGYLQPFIVEQDPERYTAVDHAVWRFVLLMLQDRLQSSAHPSHRRGLAQSAITAERIPSIGEIDRGLSSLGWGAVCVDGFIPPRAFQAFQSLGVLPIAAEIRSPEHLPYTPAPDIIHEAAGHAPILIDPEYGAYLRAVGEVGARAFASPADARIDRAVRALSELKENPSDDATVRDAERELERAVAELGPPSEASRVARLYWWTAEYGLVGTLEEYRLYGAGLLSSLGESHFCHSPEVKKHVLSAECTSVGYDITRPQPQLFVARDFEHLHLVLEEVSQTLAYEIGGRQALSAALRSGELCTVYFPGGLQVIGGLQALEGPEALGLVRFERGAALARRGKLLGAVGEPLPVALGKLEDGSDPQRLLNDPGHARRPGERLVARYASGLEVSGARCEGPWQAGDALLWLRDVRVEWRGELFTHASVLPWLCADRAITASAGSACPEVSPLGAAEGQPAASGRAIVPKRRAIPPAAARLEQLYVAAAEARRQGPAGRAALAAIAAELGASQPRHWLLLWNLLEALLELGLGGDPLAARLEQRLLELELEHGGEHPIALGLDYLRRQR